MRGTEDPERPSSCLSHGLVPSDDTTKFHFYEKGSVATVFSTHGTWTSWICSALEISLTTFSQDFTKYGPPLFVPASWSWCYMVSFASDDLQVHFCGPGGSMRACHAVGPGSIPGRDKFPGWGFSSPVRQMSGSFRPLRSPNIIWPSLSSIIFHYGRQWPEMLTRPKTSNIHAWSSTVKISMNGLTVQETNISLNI